MAVVAKRGDTVLVHSTTHGLHGLFWVDAVKGNAVTIAPLDHPGKVAGGHKGSFPTIDATTDIFAIYRPDYVRA